MTKVEIVKTTGGDILQLCASPGVEKHPSLNETNAHLIDDVPHTHSVIDVYGKVWAVGGIFSYEDGSHEAWFIMDPAIRPHLKSVVKAMRKVLASHPAKEIEAWIDVNFDGGHRWITMLGFHKVVPIIVQNRQGPNCTKYSFKKKE